MSVRTGIGVDSHRFEAGRRLVLGGVDIPHDAGLAGHSDADVLTHAIVDAGCPIALSSDAHVPDQLGFSYEDAVGALEDAGVRELCVFEGRERRLEPIG